RCRSSKGLSLSPVTCHNENDLHHRDLSALFSSVLGGHVAVARILLQAGADPNEESGVHGTLLEVASERGYLEVVKTLIDHGANVNKLAKFHSTVLQAAAAHGHADIVQHLLNNGAKLTPAHNADEEDDPFADETTDQDTIVETMSLDDSSYLKNKAPHSLSPPPPDPFRVLGLGDVFRAFDAGRTFAQGESEEIDEAILDRIFAEHTVSFAYDHDYQQLRKDNLRSRTTSGTFSPDPMAGGDEPLEEETLSPFPANHAPASGDWA
ncbi:MAG: hypothetical protein Q9214_007568, partial [Letrouitia sp. 1 TL-2023]